MSTSKGAKHKKAEKEDAITEQLLHLSSAPLVARALTHKEKEVLIQKIGIKTITNLLKAKKDFPLKRIPFLFNSLDPQDVIDVLQNDWPNISV